MIKSELSLASIQDANRQKVMEVIFTKRLQKLISEFNMHPTIVQFAPGKAKGTYRPLGQFVVMLCEN